MSCLEASQNSRSRQSLLLSFPSFGGASATSMTASLEGQLSRKAAVCAWQAATSINSRLIIWQPDYFPTLNGEQIEVLNREKARSPARLGEPISRAGGEVQLNNYAGQLRQPYSNSLRRPIFPDGKHGFALCCMFPLRVKRWLNKPRSTGLLSCKNQLPLLNLPPVAAIRRP